MRNVYLVINQQAYRNQIENDCCDNHPVAKAHTGQTFFATVIFGDGLKRNAPPKIAVKLNIPVVPAAVCRVTPAFFIQQSEQFPQEVMTVSTLFAPKNSSTETTS